MLAGTHVGNCRPVFKRCTPAPLQLPSQTQLWLINSTQQPGSSYSTRQQLRPEALGRGLVPASVSSSSSSQAGHRLPAQRVSRKTIIKCQHQSGNGASRLHSNENGNGSAPHTSSQLGGTAGNGNGSSSSSSTSGNTTGSITGNSSNRGDGITGGSSSSSSGGVGNGSNGAAGGGGNGRRRTTTSNSPGDNEHRALHILAAATAASVWILIGAVWFLLTRVSEVEAAAHKKEVEVKEVGCIRDSISALKRLLREVFADQLGIKGRLDGLEKAAAVQLEAADDYQLQLAAGSSTSSWVRAPVRMCGWFSAAGILPWSQESSSSADVVAMLSGLGASGQADGRLQLHSVLAGGKRRITADLGQVLVDGVPSLQLQRLLYRVKVRDWLQLMIAPLGGSLDAIGPSITPINAGYGCTHAMRQGHGLSVFDRSGSGKAACVNKGCLSASAGFFVGGTGKTSLAQLQVKGREGHSLSVVAASCRPRNRTHRETDDSSSSQQPGMRFLGVQAPGRSASSSSSSSSSEAASTVLGVAGVLPIRDALTATAWAERPSSGQAGWGVGLYSQPDPQGVELGMVLGQPSAAQHTAFRDVAPPVFCELTAKVPVGDGLSISPGALLTFRGGQGTLAYVMQSSWRF